MKIVIRAGGTGTRLWPMSRQNNPKQFQKIVGEDSMIATTQERIKPLLASSTDLFVSVNQQLAERLQQELPDLTKTNIIIETSTRNTGPAMCLEVCYLSKFCQPKDIVASLPADDYISNAEAFRHLLLSSEQFLQTHPDYIITPAVRPGYLDTGYSYMKIGQSLSQSADQAIYEVADVVEKPNEERCKELIEAGTYYCHAGMYIWQLDTISQLFQEFQPEMYRLCSEVVELMLVDSPDWTKIASLYGQLEKMTIESAITDKAPKIAMSVSGQVGWSDLGKWHVIKRLLADNQENLLKGEVLVNEAHNNLVYNVAPDKKIIVLNEVSNLVIVDTGDVLLVSSLDRSAEVKKCVEKLKQEGQEKYL